MYGAIDGGYALTLVMQEALQLVLVHIWVVCGVYGPSSE